MAAVIVATNTERASNLTLSQSVVELAIRVTEKESSTLFFSDGISPPSDSAKVSNFFEIDALIDNLFYIIYKCKHRRLVYIYLLTALGRFSENSEIAEESEGGTGSVLGVSGVPA